MTELLAADSRRIIAIEADPLLATRLRQRAHDWPNVEVIEGDILELDFDKFAPPRFRVYGNLPYYITSPILHRLFELAARIASIHIVVQLEVAERIVAPWAAANTAIFLQHASSIPNPKSSCAFRPAHFGRRQKSNPRCCK